MFEDKKNKIEDHFNPPYKEKYENLRKLLFSAFNQLEKIQNVVDMMEQDERKNYYQGIPGTEGKFDGQYLIAEDGRKTEVPENYAAKSRLVYGDVLKVFNDTGKQVFKQIDRVERKKVEGVLAKKEGKWYLLSDTGSFRVSDASAVFNSAQLNDKASAYIPADNPNAPWAALDEVYGENGKRSGGLTNHFEKKVDFKGTKETKISLPEKTEGKKEVKREVKREEKSSRPKPKFAKRPEAPKKEEKKKETKTEAPKEFVNNILDDDDLR